MEITTLTDFRKNMKSYFDRVLQLRSPLFISRPKGEDMVLMSKEEYESMQETFYLLKSPRNAERVLAAVEADRNGKATLREIED